jgi:hypothetical protein
MLLTTGRWASRLFELHDGKHGSPRSTIPRITASLRELGWAVSQNAVAVLMADVHPAARRWRRGTTPPS